MVDAVRGAGEAGFSFGAPTEGEVRLAEEIILAVPSIEMVRLVNSGTEATMSALRLARAFTRRDKIVKFAGCYHGHNDSLLVAAGSGAAAPLSLQAGKKELEKARTMSMNAVRPCRFVMDLPLLINISLGFHIK